MFTLRADLGAGSLTISAQGDTFDECVASFREKLDQRVERYREHGQEMMRLSALLGEGDTPTPVVES